MNEEKLVEKVYDVICRFDQGLADHCRRTAELVSYVADKLGMETDHLTKAAVIHDIGKIFVNPDILTKPDILTEEERKLIDLHSVTGCIYAETMGIPENICKIILLHHGSHKEKYGREYVEFNHQYAEVLRACDIMDAVTHDRPYHKGVSMQEALDILRSQKEPIPEAIIHVLENC